jgi:hypothetical protein
MGTGAAAGDRPGGRVGRRTAQRVAAAAENAGHMMSAQIA